MFERERSLGGPVETILQQLDPSSSKRGRPLVLVVGILELFNIPIGTAVGIYTLWVLLRDPRPRPDHDVGPVVERAAGHRQVDRLPEEAVPRIGDSGSGC